MLAFDIIITLVESHVQPMHTNLLESYLQFWVLADAPTKKEGTETQT